MECSHPNASREIEIKLIFTFVFSYKNCGKANCERTVTSHFPQGINKFLNPCFKVL